MNMNRYTRRHVLKSYLRAAAGSALAGTGMSKRAAAQFGPPSPLDDSRIRLVTTTEKDAWQSKPVYKPQFGWDVLNLNVDPVEVRPGSKPMAGFGACFNE